MPIVPPRQNPEHVGGTCTRLLARDPGDVVALRKGRAVTAAEFLAQVGGLARELPDRGAIINVCEDRYHFLVGFAAALTRGLATLLPPNSLDATVHALHREWSASSVLTDVPGRRLDAPILCTGPLVAGPAINAGIPGSTLAAVVFTSGTTGASLPHHKTWQSLLESTARNLRYYLPAGQGSYAVVSTVPAQHMYGFETTALPALRGAIRMHDGRPFYPADVAATLCEVPEPCVLVSTPVHLHALAASGLAFPRLARVLSATSPLQVELANTLEKLFGCDVLEIYGSTEVGSMASRRTAVSNRWHFFDGLTARLDGNTTVISAGHLPEPVQLPDCLEFGEDGSFLLVGRDSDLVKIGGKRTSLAEVTRLILAIPGVDDAVVFRAPGATDSTRLAALVASRSLDSGAVRSALKSVLDPVFIPRPILGVSALPRSATGKLTQDAVLRLFAQARPAESPGG